MCVILGTGVCCSSESKGIIGRGKQKSLTGLTSHVLFTRVGHFCILSFLILHTQKRRHRKADIDKPFQKISLRETR